MRKMHELGALTALVLLAWTGTAGALDAYGHREAPAKAYDLLVVAGCRVDPNGQPSQALQRRTALAVKLWKEGRAPKVVFTGGVGAFPPSEAAAAATYAEGLGLPRAAMVLEEKSTSTEENALFAAEILRRDGVPAENVLLVSDAYHIFRAERVFQRSFPKVRGVGSTPSWSVRIRGALREVLALSAYAVMGRLNAPPRDES